MASFLDGITNGLSNLGSGLYNTASDVVSGTKGMFGIKGEDYEKELEFAKFAAEGYGDSTFGAGDGEGWTDEKEEQFNAEWYEQSTAKAASGLKKTGKALGKYKEQPQEKTAVATSNAPKQGISGPKGYGRGEQAEPYEQMQRGMSTGDLEKMLLEAMRSNARMSIFQGGFKGGLL